MNFFQKLASGIVLATTVNSALATGAPPVRQPPTPPTTPNIDVDTASRSTANNNNTNSSTANNNNTNSSTANNGGNSLTGGNNNIDASDHSIYKFGAASNIPSAAAIFATKECTSSSSFGIGGGTVYSGYAGISFSYVPSGALELKATTENGKEASYTIVEFANFDPEQRAEITSAMSFENANLASCLASNYAKQESVLTKAYKQAIEVARLRGQVDMYLGELEAKKAKDVAQIENAGNNLGIAMKHFCAEAVGQHPVTVPSGNTQNEANRNKDTEHAACFKIGKQLADILTNNTAAPTKPNLQAPMVH